MKYFFITIADLNIAIAPGGYPPCFCAEGYVRDTVNGNCVLQEECTYIDPPACENPHEIRTGCETDCNDMMLCAAILPGGYLPCLCEDGYVRNTESGNCVLREECPRVEPPPCEGLNEIRTGCETDCDNMTKCAGIVPGGFAPCFCEDGYRRDANQECILAEDCPVDTPPPPAGNLVMVATASAAT